MRIGLFVIVVALTFYFLQDKQAETAFDTSAVATTAPETVQTHVIPDGWREYRNSTYRFSLLHPQALEVKEYPEEGNAMTITFQDIKKKEGFQLFIVPYQEPQVSEERFKKDIPSGVRIDLTNITVDSATGAAFYSSNVALGETREVWFIHGGYLYEVTTLKLLDAWMDEIIQTWKFL